MNFFFMFYRYPEAIHAKYASASIPKCIAYGNYVHHIIKPQPLRRNRRLTLINNRRLNNQLMTIKQQWYKVITIGTAAAQTMT